MYSNIKILIFFQIRFDVESFYNGTQHDLRLVLGCGKKCLIHLSIPHFGMLQEVKDKLSHAKQVLPGLESLLEPGDQLKKTPT